MLSALLKSTSAEHSRFARLKQAYEGSKKCSCTHFIYDVLVLSLSSDKIHIGVQYLPKNPPIRGCQQHLSASIQIKTNELC